MSYRHLAEALLRGQPYFGPAMCALQGPPERQRYFLPVVRAAAQDSSVEILEVGSWAGASAVSWASALKKLNLAGHVTCVDSWVSYFDPETEPSRHYHRMNQAASHGMIRKLFDHNVAASGFSETIFAKPGKSSAILPTLASHNFDVVYLDGSHAFEDVLFDVRQAKRLVRPGGIICGDDLELQLKDLDPEEGETAARGGQDYVLSSSRGVRYHPGVTLAAAQEFGEVCEWEGFWAVRSSETEWIKVTIDLADSELPEHVAAAGLRIEDETLAYYVISCEGRYFALAKKLGPPDLAAELLCDEDLPPFVLNGATLEEVREKMQQYSALEQYPTPSVVDSHRGFNLVRLNHQVYGLRQSLGPVDIGPGGSNLSVDFSSEDAIIGMSLEEVKARIDAVEAELALFDLTKHLQELVRIHGRA